MWTARFSLFSFWKFCDVLEVGPCYVQHKPHCLHRWSSHSEAPLLVGNGRSTLKSQVSRCQPRASLARRPFWRQKPQACCADPLLQSSPPLLCEQSHTPRSLLVTVLKYMETFFKLCILWVPQPSPLTERLQPWGYLNQELEWDLPKDVCSWVAFHCLIGHMYGRFLEGS